MFLSRFFLVVKPSACAVFRFPQSPAVLCDLKLNGVVGEVLGRVFCGAMSPLGSQFFVKNLKKCLFDAL